MNSFGFWGINLADTRVSGGSEFTGGNAFFGYTASGGFSTGDLIILTANGALSGAANEHVNTGPDNPTNFGNHRPVAPMTLSGGPIVLLHAGWNLVALPISSPSSLTAQSLLAAINAQGGSATEVDQWQDGSWRAHVLNFPFNNFTIAPGSGYFVKAGAPSAWHAQLSTLTPKAAAATSVQLNSGWNLIALPPGAANNYTAQSLLDEIKAQGGSPVEMDRWVDGTWQAFIFGLPLWNYDLAKGQGYFVRVNAPSTWTPQ